MSDLDGHNGFSDKIETEYSSKFKEWSKNFIFTTRMEKKSIHSTKS